jgi:hypothetical protein
MKLIKSNILLILSLILFGSGVILGSNAKAEQNCIKCNSLG